MKISRALIAAASTVALVLGAGAASATAEDAPQPLTLVGPATGTKVDSPYVTFEWQAPADQVQAVIAVSTTSTTKNGRLPSSGKDADAFYVDSAASNFTDKRYAYPPDTYWWQVTSRDAAGNTYRSEVRKFVVPVFFQLSKLKAKTISVSGTRAVLVTGVMRCNYAEDQYYTQFTMKVLAGKRSFGRGATGYGNCVGMYPTKVESLLGVSGVAKGTKLTLKVSGRSVMDSTVRWGGANIKKANGPVTTLHYTWKG